MKKQGTSAAHQILGLESKLRNPLRQSIPAGFNQINSEEQDTEQAQSTIKDQSLTTDRDHIDVV